ncbi:2-oxo-4-hydroxy-4-carboxy-5-ureidoimidazoline decarboxylase [Paenibacillus macerans]|uniref:2-oxo-4-hydroxy-4-carboxy-5-ureidoimidazoline decarboxylase n=1 Tax=Paenibacillus macerans TaxID=44252 RepID=UPI003D32000D
METNASMPTLKLLNRMSKEEFTEALGGIFEHSPWIAEAAFGAKPFGSVGELHGVMLSAVRNASRETALRLLRAHPDLATQIQVTPLSAAEQQGAGLDRLTPEEFAALTDLNRRYTEKFGFPFILAVRGKNKDDILRSISERIESTPDREYERALAEVATITRFRLGDLVLE